MHLLTVAESTAEDDDDPLLPDRVVVPVLRGAVLRGAVWVVAPGSDADEDVSPAGTCEFEAPAEGEPEPLDDKAEMVTTISTITMTSDPTASRRRRQYTDGGCEPTG
ncbi:hypothetical protein [Jatrophihabitans endophyticus]|uniref:hypothetical protein n=1 Tax=Jatrophihabitans endophyticus TaxID=1206085 RepID=UPI0019E30A2A|nr:hypothetical protein [Jatrophihabitans endophyticus]MBE7189330.1 hypothetical protein [Jatrophihabitans endophyticus]